MLEESREGYEGGYDIHTLKDSPKLQKMKTLQDLGSREGLGEAAGYWKQSLILSSC